MLHVNPTCMHATHARRVVGKAHFVRSTAAETEAVRAASEEDGGLPAAAAARLSGVVEFTASKGTET